MVRVTVSIKRGLKTTKFEVLRYLESIVRYFLGLFRLHIFIRLFIFLINTCCGIISEKISWLGLL